MSPKELKRIIDKEFSHLGKEQRDAIYRSRLGIMKNDKTDISKLVKVDMGPNASKKHPMED